MSLYIAAYDITCDRRRARVARVLDSYGERAQLSVFELWLDPDDLPRLRLEVGALLHVNDAFDLWPIDERGSRRRVSWQRSPEHWNPVILL